MTFEIGEYKVLAFESESRIEFTVYRGNAIVARGIVELSPQQGTPTISVKQGPLPANVESRLLERARQLQQVRHLREERESRSISRGRGRGR